ncbi:MAG: hypothetical protein JWP78_1443 [Mucilaginibacter sp.]|nr:hypothetical protein [Mucilaginibacter sp.]
MQIRFLLATETACHDMIISGLCAQAGTQSDNGTGLKEAVNQGNPSSRKNFLILKSFIRVPMANKPLIPYFYLVAGK